MSQSNHNRMKTEPCISPESPFMRKPSRQMLKKLNFKKSKQVNHQQALLQPCQQNISYIHPQRYQGSFGSTLKLKKSTVQLSSFKIMHENMILKNQLQQLKKENQELTIQNQILKNQLNIGLTFSPNNKIVPDSNNKNIFLLQSNQKFNNKNFCKNQQPSSPILSFSSLNLLNHRKKVISPLNLKLKQEQQGNENEKENNKNKNNINFLNNKSNSAKEQQKISNKNQISLCFQEDKKKKDKNFIYSNIQDQKNNLKSSSNFNEMNNTNSGITNKIKASNRFSLDGNHNLKSFSSCRTLFDNNSNNEATSIQCASQESGSRIKQLSFSKICENQTQISSSTITINKNYFDPSNNNDQIENQLYSYVKKANKIIENMRFELQSHKQKVQLLEQQIQKEKIRSNKLQTQNQALYLHIQLSKRKLLQKQQKIKRYQNKEKRQKLFELSSQSDSFY